MTPHANGLCVFAVKGGDTEKRFDTHFYSPQYQLVVKEIKNGNDYTNIGKVVTFSKETTNFSEYKDGKFEYLEISGVSLGLNSYHTTTTSVSQAPSRAKMKTRAGDIVISTTRPHRGAIAQIQSDGIVASTGFSIIRDIDSTINRKWLLYTLLTQSVLQQMLQRSSGGNYPAIIEEEIKNIYIPLVNMPKQEEMAGFMESALKERTRLHQLSHKKLNEFDIKVTRRFSLECKNQEKRYYAIRLKNIDGVIDAKRYAAINRRTGKFTVGDVCDVLEGKINVSHFDKQMIDWIRIDDLPNQPLDIEEIRTQPANEVEGIFFEVKEGDILVARLGPTILNQKIVMIRSLERTTIASAEFLVLRCKEGYYPEAVMAVLKTAYYRELMYSQARGSTPSRYRLNREDMLKLPFPDIRGHQERLAAEAYEVREKVKSMRTQAEQGWQEAKEQFENELLGRKVKR